MKLIRRAAHRIALIQPQTIFGAGCALGIVGYLAFAALVFYVTR